MKIHIQKHNQYKKLVDTQLHQCVQKKKPNSLYEPIRYILAGGGKRIRPLLTIFACEAVGGKGKNALHAAVALEILHNFTLVHDDIMDNAAARRGRATIHTKWDSNVAILAGDELIAIAYRELLKTQSPEIARITNVFTDGVVEVCEGQALDKEYEYRTNVTIHEYLEMISKKTGKMIAIAAEIGAIIGGGTEKEIQILKNYGTSLGRAFQIQDDLLDVIADEKEFGKTIGGDIVEGKKTFLFIEAYQRAKGEDKKFLHKVLLNNGTTKKNISHVREIYKKYGVLELAHNFVTKDITKANQELQKLRNPKAKETLYWFSEMVLGRKF